MGYTSEWTKTDSAETNPGFKCRRCQSHNISFRDWESYDEAHEDTHYRCDDCGKEWWVEGSDA